MILRTDDMEMDDRRELQRMLEFTTRLGKGGDSIRRLYVDWCCEEVCRARGFGGLSLKWPKDVPYPVEQALVQVQLLWHHHGFPPETALRGLEALLKRWQTDICAAIPVVGASLKKRVEETAVRLAGTRVSS